MANPAASGAAAAPVSSCTVESMFSRRIDFHPARKPYSHGSGGNFQLETLNPGADSRKPAGGPAAAPAPSIGKKSDGGEFYEHGLDPELGFRITFRRIGAGLVNLGNTCFLNSVVQCLTYTEPFAAYLQSGKHKSTCHTPGFCAMCALQNHVMNALQSTGKILSPMHLVKNLRCISRNFRNSRQEDAHEYMVNLLESMHRCCLPSGVPSESPRAFEKSLVHKIFGGQLRSQVKCMQCSYCSNKFDPFLDLSLEIVKADSVRKALLHFTAVEQLDGGEKQYQCQHCKEKVRALKQLTIHKPPYVLTVHLKRFSAANPGEKINRKVEFEPTLDLKPFVSDRHEGTLKYTLYGVLVHAGWSTHSGHYYCFVRTSSGMWHSLDDNQVFQVSEKTVLAQKAYMLFYVRDRSQTLKRSVDASPRDNILTNGLGNKLVSQSVSSQNGDPFSISDNSGKPPGRNEASLQNVKTMPPAAPNVQNNNHVSQKDATMLQNKGDPSKVLQGTNPKILKENGTHENGGVANSIAQKSITVLKMENNNVSSKKEAIKISSQQENAVLVEHQDVGFKDKCLSKYQSQNDGQNLPKVDESLSANLLKNPITTGIQTVAVQETIGSDVPKEVLEVADVDFSVSTSFDTQLKQKKLAKCSRVRSKYLGRSKIFLASLSLQKNKKHKRRRQHGASSKHIKDESLRDHDLGISTYEAAGVAAEDSKCAPKKRSYSSLNSQSNSQELNGANHHQVDGVNLKDRETQKCRVNVAPVQFQQLNSSSRSTSNQHDAPETSTHGNTQNQRSILNLLMQGLKETTVPKWDDAELPSSEMQGNGQIGSIGYVLDEWDAEYDQGRRKKVKGPKASFSGPNLFQETANMKAQQKMKTRIVPTSSGNQPYRI